MQSRLTWQHVEVVTMVVCNNNDYDNNSYPATTRSSPSTRTSAPTSTVFASVQRSTEKNKKKSSREQEEVVVGREAVIAVVVGEVVVSVKVLTAMSHPLEVCSTKSTHPLHQAHLKVESLLSR